MTFNKDDLALYRCHKEVRAVQIAAIEFAEDGSAKIATLNAVTQLVHTKPGYRERFKVDVASDDLGYLVVYADGYESWSPTKAFEDGYTKVEQ